MTTKKTAAKPAPEPAAEVEFRTEGLDLIATLPDGQGTEVSVSLSLPMGAFKQILPAMEALDETMKGDDPDPMQILESFESILPEAVVETCSQIHMPWALRIYVEWVSRLGGLMGKALSG